MTLLVPVGIVVVVILLILVFASRYRTVKADQAMIVTGALTRDGMKIVKAGGAFVWPVVQNATFLTLQVQTLDIHTPEVYTMHGVPVMVDGVAQIKIKGDQESIATAAEQFLGKPDQELNSIATQTMEGHLRAILGTMTVEDVYRNREVFARKVQEVAASDLNKMGLQIVSFTIRDVRDKNGYLDALGQPQIASVKRDAEIAKANALRDEQIAKSKALEEGKKAEYTAETNIAEASKTMEVHKAAFKQEQDMKKAEADQAYKLQEVKTLQSVKAEEMQIQVIEREKQIELEAKEIERRERELVATVKKQAEAERFAQEQRAEAERYQIEARAKAEAEAVRLAGNANADKERAEGTAEADVIRLKGLAEAEAKDKIADALQKYGQAAVVELIIQKFPDIARAIAEPLSKTEKIVIVDGGSAGPNGGAGKVTGYVTDLLAKMPETVGALTGIDLNQLVKRLAEGNSSLNQKSGSDGTNI
ncbi:flotillin family protein [Cohnella pontilimi]|uniref:Flotillin family protein n=1 Tax=Cohnella pontilimi TaxID=2564100 RepID=A0A4U0FA10_9BACL|nr:SPFH domain-containing protein [Cohnella pontilimi]TJY41606.1 flotillin family protein [Cohnella pontilimi]